MFIVYVLYSCSFNRNYVGMTSDIERRLLEHNKGLSKSTKPYIPWTLVYKEELKTSDAARAREKFLKTAAGRRWRKENINKGH